jgi:tetratricopeptide (TPR) repeat protein
MRATQRTAAAAAAILLAAGLANIGGCANKEEPSTIRPVGNKTAADMNSERSKFERSEDPPFNANTRFAAGQLAESQGAPQRAVAQYQEALKLDPKMLPAAYRLGVCYTQMRDYPKAIAAWQNYLKLTNGSATAYGNLGFCLELSGQKPQAEEAYQQGIAKDPKNQPCRINYGLMLARAGRIDDALQQLRAVLSEAESHYNLASVYEQQGKKAPAREEYAKALELDPGMWEAKQRLEAMT